jgi:hypothetical protein
MTENRKELQKSWIGRGLFHDTIQVFGWGGGSETHRLTSDLVAANRLGVVKEEVRRCRLLYKKGGAVWKLNIYTLR